MGEPSSKKNAPDNGRESKRGSGVWGLAMLPVITLKVAPELISVFHS